MVVAFVDKDQKFWDLHLGEFTFAMNTSLHASTQITPAFLNFGRELRPTKSLREDEKRVKLLERLAPERWASRMTRIGFIRDLVTRNLDRAFQQQAKYYDRGHRAVQFAPGDLVMRRTHPLSVGKEGFSARLVPKYDGEHTILRVLSPVVYLVKLKDKKDPATVHISELKPYVPPRQPLAPLWPASSLNSPQFLPVSSTQTSPTRHEPSMDPRSAFPNALNKDSIVLQEPLNCSKEVVDPNPEGVLEMDEVDALAERLRRAPFRESLPEGYRIRLGAAREVQTTGSLQRQGTSHNLLRSRGKCNSCMRGGQCFRVRGHTPEERKRYETEEGRKLCKAIHFFYEKHGTPWLPTTFMGRRAPAGGRMASGRGRSRVSTLRPRPDPVPLMSVVTRDPALAPAPSPNRVPAPDPIPAPSPDPIPAPEPLPDPAPIPVLSPDSVVVPVLTSRPVVTPIPALMDLVIPILESLLRPRPSASTRFDLEQERPGHGYPVHPPWGTPGPLPKGCWKCGGPHEKSTCDAVFQHCYACGFCGVTKKTCPNCVDEYQNLWYKLKTAASRYAPQQPDRESLP